MLALFLVACGGPADVTVIHDVQVIHVGAEPPDVEPGQATTLTATIADPLGGGVEVLAWACTDLGAGCIEDTGQAAVDRVSLRIPVDEQVSFDLVAPASVTDPDATDTGGMPVDAFVGAWVFACRPGICPQFDLLRSDPAPGSGDDEALRDFLADPTAALVDLPVDGVSLARRRVRVRAPGEAPNGNPALALADGDPLSLSVGGETPLEVELTDETPEALQLDGATTIGGLAPARTDGSSPRFTWFAGDTPGTGRIYIVARDGLGGSAVLRADVEVTP
ncbi:MAG: hypothetical protein D6798_00685 [Deltaproteobacteria bacterium]|nr:MAG: hypothetical protein D6798_00685 [Deltaproteobacteria bacterium]